MLARPCPVIDLPRAVCPVPTCPAPICPVIVRAIRPETGRIRLTIMETSPRTITGLSRPAPICPAPICPVIVRAIRPETGRIRLTIMQTSTRSTITGVEPAMRG
jgi:hypothetical protein